MSNCKGRSKKMKYGGEVKKMEYGGEVKKMEYEGAVRGSRKKIDGCAIKGKTRAVRNV